jgi:DNA-binding PucR family transcriptional regulator
VAQPFVVMRHGELISIASLARARWAAIAQLVRHAHSELGQRGEAWAGGISTVCAGLVEVARGYQEARLAFESAAAEGGVCALLELRVHDFVLEHADGTAVRMIPPSARRLLESVASGDRVLLETLRAYARAEMSVRDAADSLDVHPNTVSYRLEKLSRLLDRDVSRFSDLVEVLSWLRILDAKGL